MGLKTIQAKYGEARKELETTIGTFLKGAREINEAVIGYSKKLDEINKASLEMGDLVYKAGQKAKALETHGIVQLDQMKRLLLVATEHAQKPHPVNLSEIEGLERQARSDIDKALQQEMDKYYEKIAAGWPSKVEVGMMFKKGDRVIEIASAEIKSTNPNLKGDAALFHKVKTVKGYSYGGELNYGRDELNPKKGWKFLKT
jgi:hypothetical protein